MTVSTKRLLILSCTKQKRSEPDLLPAIERYDGPSFRVLRRFLRQRVSSPPDVYILSARFGLIHQSDPVPFYDQRMTLARASELQSEVTVRLSQILGSACYAEVFISLGKSYWPALAGWESMVRDETVVTISTGSIGRVLNQLHRWLYGESAQYQFTTIVTRTRGVPVVRGIELPLTKQEVLVKAREALSAGVGDPDLYCSWYVQIGDRKVSTKWLVSQLTGLPPGLFTTGEARRVLEHLGIEVKRV